MHPTHGRFEDILAGAKPELRSLTRAKAAFELLPLLAELAGALR